MLLEGVEPMLPFIRAGKLRAIAVGGPRRVAVLPEVPTFEELGVKDIRTIWLGVVAPKGVPSAIVARLNRDLTTVMQSPAFSTTFESAGA
jgi:tripartite-type tricarboxylate transporter receptor subunit TctC